MSESVLSSSIDPTDSVPEGDLDVVAPVAEDLPEDRFSNRELSWLAFNARVLALAEDPEQPLLERVKFLAIFASNLDEFYMVRVAGLKRRAVMGLQVHLGRRAVSPREVLGHAGRTHPRTRRRGRRAASATTSRPSSRPAGHPHPPVGRARRRGTLASWASTSGPRCSRC